MDPARWQVIEETFNAALALPPEERGAFLDSACAQDSKLRSQIESLINEVKEPDDFLSESAFTLGAQVLAQADGPSLDGQKFGAYTIVRRLGRGGMGEVYLAQDERLGRRAAIKLLPSQLTEDEDRIRRFKHEARAASAISHPNVAHIYEIGEVAGRLFIAMEFVDGLTLRERLGRADLKMGEAIEIAAQVASAIAAAHDEGIVHRDIKPENIIIRRDGLVKVVDFGLAKLSDTDGKAADDLRHTQPGNRMTRVVETEPGLLLGTATYMSPEQARGTDIDARTDVWSWGVVFYEMLAGQPPFTGGTNSDVIAEILKSDPLARSSFLNIPASAAIIIRRALSKDRNLRYPKMSHVVTALHDLRSEAKEKFDLPLPQVLSTGAAEVPGRDSLDGGLDQRKQSTSPIAVSTGASAWPQQSGSNRAAKSSVSQARRFLIWSGLGLAILAVAFMVLSRYDLIPRRSAAPSSQALEIAHLTNDGRIMDAALSPDARLLAYVPIESGKQSLRVRDLESGENWELLPPDPAFCWGMRFTPNGQSILYLTKQPNSTIGVLFRIPVRGGASTKIAVNVDGPPGISPDGMRLAFVRTYPGQHRDALIVTDIDGSAERELANRQHPDKFSFSGPSWSPDSKLIALGAGRNSEAECAVIAVRSDSGALVELTPWQWAAVGGMVWKNDGRALIVSARSLHSKVLRLWRLSYPDGGLQPLTDENNAYEEVTLAQNANALVTMKTYEVSDIWTVTSEGATERLTRAGHDGADGLAVTPAGRVIFTEGEYEQSILWSMNFDGSDRRRLSQNTGFLPTASLDGRTVAYVSTAQGTHHVWLMQVDGQNNHQLTFGGGENYPSLSPDGHWVVYTSLAQGRGTLWRIPTAGGEPIQITYTGISRRPVVSPDGSMIACTFRIDESDKWKIAILPFNGGPAIKSFSLPFPYLQIIRWRSDSQALIYVDKREGAENLWQQPLDGSPPKQLTNFSEELVLHHEQLAGKFFLSRGGRKRDAVLIRNFD